jgi:phage-related minor tail protein
VIFKEAWDQFFSRLACRFARKNHSVADRIMELHERIKLHKKQSRQLATEMERVERETRQMESEKEQLLITNAFYTDYESSDNTESEESN